MRCAAGPVRMKDSLYRKIPAQLPPTARQATLSRCRLRERPGELKKMSLWVRRGGILALLLFSVSSGQSEISNVQILGVSNVQALVGFAAPAEATCKVAVSESASFDPLVNDVNPVLFAGADSA